MSSSALSARIRRKIALSPMRSDRIADQVPCCSNLRTSSRWPPRQTSPSGSTRQSFFRRSCFARSHAETASASEVSMRSPAMRCHRWRVDAFGRPALEANVASDICSPVGGQVRRIFAARLRPRKRRSCVTSAVGSCRRCSRDRKAEIPTPVIASISRKLRHPLG
jgi:hypothetical protein